MQNEIIQKNDNCISKYIFFLITERYDYVGKLLKPGEAPTNYSDEEDEGSQQETETKPESIDTEKKTDHSEAAEKSKSD